MKCRAECGACCIAPGISLPFYGMPGGKPPGVPCVHLTATLQCALFGDPRRPRVCETFLPEPAFCGTTREQALDIMASIEVQTARSEQ